MPLLPRRCLVTLLTALPPSFVTAQPRGSADAAPIDRSMVWRAEGADTSANDADRLTDRRPRPASSGLFGNG